MADSQQRKSVAYNEKLYVPPSDEEDSGNEDYEISIPDSNLSDGHPEDAEMEANVSTSELVTGANNVLYHDVQTNIPVPPNATLEISTPQNSPQHFSTPPISPVVPSTQQNASPNISHEYDTDGDENAYSSDNSDDNDEVEGIEGLEGIARDIPADPSLLQITPIQTFANDIEDPDDFANGWEWITQEDPGPATEDFTAFPGLVIPPNDRTPASFFKLLFDEPMFGHIAEQTNLYAQKKIQGKENSISLLYMCRKIKF